MFINGEYIDVSGFVGCVKKHWENGENPVAIVINNHRNYLGWAKRPVDFVPDVTLIRDGLHDLQSYINDNKDDNLLLNVLVEFSDENNGKEIRKMIMDNFTAKMIEGASYCFYTTHELDNNSEMAEVLLNGEPCSLETLPGDVLDLWQDGIIPVIRFQNTFIENYRNSHGESSAKKALIRDVKNVFKMLTYTFNNLWKKHSRSKDDYELIIAMKYSEQKTDLNCFIDDVFDDTEFPDSFHIFFESEIDLEKPIPFTDEYAVETCFRLWSMQPQDKNNITVAPNLVIDQDTIHELFMDLAEDVAQNSYDKHLLSVNIDQKKFAREICDRFIFPMIDDLRVADLKMEKKLIVTFVTDEHPMSACILENLLTYWIDPDCMIPDTFEVHVTGPKHKKEEK